MKFSVTSSAFTLAAITGSASALAVTANDALPSVPAHGLYINDTKFSVPPRVQTINDTQPAGVMTLDGNQPCLPLHESKGPLPVPNNLEGFKGFRDYALLANEAKTPHGYNRVIMNAHGAVKSDTFMTYLEMDSYNVDECAAFCDMTHGCDSFNIFFLRHPSLEPSAACPNPEHSILIRCGLYAERVDASAPLEHGQIRGPADSNGNHFIVAIAGSNAYNRKVVAPRIKETVTVTVTADAKNTVAPKVGVDCPNIVTMTYRAEALTVTLTKECLYSTMAAQAMETAINMPTHV